MMMNRAISNLVVATVLVGACGDGGGSMATDAATMSSSTGTPTSTTDSASPTGSTTVATTQSPTSTTTGEVTTAATGAISVTDTDGSSTGDISTGTTDPGTSNGPILDLGGTCFGPGEPDVSYIWIANSEQGTISKIITVKAANCGVYSGIQAVA